MPFAAFLPAITAGIGALGNIFGGAAKGSQDSRMSQDMINAQLYNARTRGEVDKGQLDLAQQQFGLQAPGERARSVISADLLNNVKDFTVGRPGAWGAQGGIRPSAMTDMSKVAALLAARPQMNKLQTGEQLYRPNFGTAPQPSKAGWFEKLLGGLGLAGGIVGGLQQGGLLGPKPPSPEPWYAPGMPSQIGTPIGPPEPPPLLPSRNPVPPGRF